MCISEYLGHCKSIARSEYGLPYGVVDKWTEKAFTVDYETGIPASTAVNMRMGEFGFSTY